MTENIHVSDDIIYSCRICLEEGTRQDFIAPCVCSGTMKWVHRSCLDRWRSIRDDKAFSSCTECLVPYKLVCVNSTSSNNFDRKLRFACYLIRDFTVTILAANIIVVLIGLLSFLVDKSLGNSLINSLHMTRYRYLFYYFVGLTLSLSCIGMFFSCTSRQTRNNHEVICCSGMDGMYFYPYPYAGTDAPVVCCNCCPAECAGAHCTTGNLACCECGECASAGAVGEEAAICVIGIVIVFAIVGVFYSIVMGAYYVQYITQRHIHVLGKLNLTKEYIVADLAEGALLIQSDGKSHLLDDNSVDPEYKYSSSSDDVENALHTYRIHGSIDNNNLLSEDHRSRGTIEMSATSRSGFFSSSSNGSSYSRLLESAESAEGKLEEYNMSSSTTRDITGSSIIQPTSTAQSTSSSLSSRQRDELIRLGLL